MKKIWEFFEKLDEIVYVTDMDTYDMIYMNEEGLKVYGLTDRSQIKGRKCYELLQGSSSPCAMCTNAQLREGEFLQWSYYNPRIQRTVKIKDTMVMDEGRRCRIELAISENTDLEQKGRLLDIHKTLERITQEAFDEALRAESPDNAMEAMLEYLGKAMKAERIYIFEKNSEGNDDNTYEWVASGVSAEIDKLQNLPAEVCAQWYERFESGETVIIKNLEDIRETDPQMYATLKPQNIHTLVTGPLRDGDKIFGFYGVDNPPAELLEYSSDLLRIMGQFTAVTLRMRNLLRELRHSSNYDQLTELGNRRAMLDRVNTLDPEQSLGVVFCDVTGLKMVNDTQGHKAGDALLIRAAECLRQVFLLGDIFRIGGDEMVVLCSGSSNLEMLDERVERLRTEMVRHDVNMAVGTSWQAHGPFDIDYLLREAERKMYADKEHYYRTSGLDRRGHHVYSE